MPDAINNGNSGYAYLIWDGAADNNKLYGINVTPTCWIEGTDVVDNDWRMVVQNDAGAEYIKSDAGSDIGEKGSYPLKQVSIS